MKILHCCLAAFYIDNYGYQENVLPKMHKLQGHEVMIIASTETLIDNKVLGYTLPASYYTAENIPIVRLPYVKYLPHALAKKMRLYDGLMTIIDSFKPDCIFIHDVQFLSILAIAKYARNRGDLLIYADGHTDFVNSARNWVSKYILHKIIYKYCAKKIEPYTRKFYGVLPARVDFFKKVYGIKAEKVDLLVMGGDHTNIDFSKRETVKSFVRAKYEIHENDFLIVTGGKIDELKNIHLLMRAVVDINISNIKLLVFGNVNDRLKAEFDSLCKSELIKYVGWVPADMVYEYFMSSDLAFFPGTHSVLWEQSVSLGLPTVFKYWSGMQHVDVGGNALFLDEVNVDTVKEIVLRIYNNKELYSNMRKIAIEKGIPHFSYYEIAKRAIEL